MMERGGEGTARCEGAVAEPCHMSELWSGYGVWGGALHLLCRTAQTTRCVTPACHTHVPRTSASVAAPTLSNDRDASAPLKDGQ